MDYILDFKHISCIDIRFMYADAHRDAWNELDARQPVLEVSYHIRTKSACSANEKIEILH